MNEKDLLLCNGNIVNYFDHNYSFIVSGIGLRIEEDVIITNNSKTWEHKVKKQDKIIRITNKHGSFDLDVIEKKKSIEVLHSPNLPKFYSNSSSINIVPQSYLYNLNTELKFIVTDDYSCRIIPFDGLYRYIKVSSRTNIIKNISSQEETAIEALREMISERDFRKYLRDGFILVKGKSGKIYQIFRQYQHIKVWKHGRITEEICIGFKNGKIPLTDKVLAFKIMIETDENDFWKFGNIYKMNIAA